ncbi:acyl--CoA ligase family protein [Desulfallas thermosapovorans]|uniref:Fatty-acyl-CoA synthase n=1 Tax=Desulfallas thermosapovorans DSM 6562 TaxID=1121431 RepID=A0A5S4ZTY4_9FIRM|nr:acyl--CoA ligase family protein [Desulfallas thermosapovorans]TYO96237.1 fatty-acyl-CoA synthase [Desulfallas thermosapovorans DSM 6562]
MRGTNYEPLSPLSFLERSAFVFPDKKAVIYNDQSFTYAEFKNRVDRFATALKQQGIEKGDKVAFLCPNLPPLLEAHYAVPLVGGVLVSINIRLASQEVAYILQHSESKMLFVDTEFAGIIKPILGEIGDIKIINICDVEPKAFDGPDYEEFIAVEPEEFYYGVDDEQQPITLNYTSGTTGKPKGVLYTHRGTYLNALGELLEFQCNSSTTYLWTLPMFHCNGWCFTWAITAIGGTHVCLRKAVPEDIYRNIQEHGVSHLCAAPAVLIPMSNYKGIGDVQMKRHLNIMTAGAPPSPTVIKNMESVGCTVMQTYGLTEVYGPHSVCEWQPQWNDLDIDEQAKIKARQGVPYITAVYMDVVNPSTMEPVPHDGETIGEIVMRGNNVMAGYYKQPEDTKQAFRGGWFHSGDLAVTHPNGYVEIKDRMKDIIISGGENISTVEVENVIYQHPGVLEVAVVAVPDEKWGEVPKAFVTLKEGVSLTAEDIIQFCRERIAKFKAPKAVEFGELPKTSTGKIMKYKLRAKEWAGRDKKVN